MDNAELHQSLRQSVREICQHYPDAYWRGLDATRGYPEAFVRALTEAGYLAALIPTEYGWIGFLLKVAFILFAYIWMRWTLPRYRYDQLMQFGWKWLFPASVLNLLVTATLMLYFNA